MPNFDDLSLLQLAALAEEFAWGHIQLTAAEREALRCKLIDRFSQVESLNKVRWQASQVVSRRNSKSG